MFRWGWTKHRAKLIDRKFVRRFETSSRNGTWIQEWDFMVELPADGTDAAVRLVIREHTYKLDLPDGPCEVPVLVNKKRTKAAFDLDGTEIDSIGKLDRRQKARKQRDEERFEKKLRGG